MSVSIAVIMKFAKLKALTTDEAVVRRALQDSSLTLVNNRIKANIKASSRSTIILRDVPANTPEEEVREIFNYDGARPIVSLRSDIEDTWYVVMLSIRYVVRTRSSSFCYFCLGSSTSKLRRMRSRLYWICA